MNFNFFLLFVIFVLLNIHWAQDFLKSINLLLENGETIKRSIITFDGYGRFSFFRISIYYVMNNVNGPDKKSRVDQGSNLWCFARNRPESHVLTNWAITSFNWTIFVLTRNTISMPRPILIFECTWKTIAYTIVPPFVIKHIETKVIYTIPCTCIVQPVF